MFLIHLMSAVNWLQAWSSRFHSEIQEQLCLTLVLRKVPTSEAHSGPRLQVWPSPKKDSEGSRTKNAKEDSGSGQPHFQTGKLTPGRARTGFTCTSCRQQGLCRSRDAHCFQESQLALLQTGGRSGDTKSRSPELGLSLANLQATWPLEKVPRASCHLVPRRE